MQVGMSDVGPPTGGTYVVSRRPIILFIRCTVALCTKVPIKDKKAVIVYETEGCRLYSRG
eukprot:scaffold219471_cov58-Attheya_sp.AAC.5